MNSIIMHWRAVFEEEENKYNKSSFVFIIFFLMGSIIYFSKIVTDLPNPDAVWNGMFFKDNCGWEISLGSMETFGGSFDYYFTYGGKYINLLLLFGFLFDKLFISGFGCLADA